MTIPTLTRPLRCFWAAALAARLRRPARAPRRRGPSRRPSRPRCPATAPARAPAVWRAASACRPKACSPRTSSASRADLPLRARADRGAPSDPAPSSRARLGHTRLRSPPGTGCPQDELARRQRALTNPRSDLRRATWLRIPPGARTGCPPPPAARASGPRSRAPDEGEPPPRRVAAARRACAACPASAPRRSLRTVTGGAAGPCRTSCSRTRDAAATRRPTSARSSSSPPNARESRWARMRLTRRASSAARGPRGSTGLAFAGLDERDCGAALACTGRWRCVLRCATTRTCRRASASCSPRLSRLAAHAAWQRSQRDCQG